MPTLHNIKKLKIYLTWTCGGVVEGGGGVRRSVAARRTAAGCDGVAGAGRVEDVFAPIRRRCGGGGGGHRSGRDRAASDGHGGDEQRAADDRSGGQRRGAGEHDGGIARYNIILYRCRVAVLRYYNIILCFSDARAGAAGVANSVLSPWSACVRRVTADGRGPRTIAYIISLYRGYDRRRDHHHHRNIAETILLTRLQVNNNNDSTTGERRGGSTPVRSVYPLPRPPTVSHLARAFSVR